MQRSATRQQSAPFFDATNPTQVVFLIALVVSALYGFFHSGWWVTPIALGIAAGALQKLRHDSHGFPQLSLPLVVGLVATHPDSTWSPLWVVVISCVLDVFGANSVKAVFVRFIASLASAVTVVLVGGILITGGLLPPWMVIGVLLLAGGAVGSALTRLLRQFGYAKVAIRLSTIRANIAFGFFAWISAGTLMEFISAEFWLGGIFCLLPLMAFVATRNATAKAERELLDALCGLARLLKHSHPYTGSHSERVSVLAESVGFRLNVCDKRLEQLKHAALLHDIGKLAVDEEVLEKPSRLTDEEFEHVKAHAEHGARILRLVWDFGPVSKWVRHHHERLDGKGYPKGIAGESIPIESRIICAIDAFDAMTGDDEEHRRPYRKNVTPQEALDELKRCAGQQFEPKVVEAFEESLKARRML